VDQVLLMLHKIDRGRDGDVVLSTRCGWTTRNNAAVVDCRRGRRAGDYRISDGDRRTSGWVRRLPHTPGSGKRWPMDGHPEFSKSTVCLLTRIVSCSHNKNLQLDIQTITRNSTEL